MRFFETEPSVDFSRCHQIRGVMVGTVTDNQDPEKLGRVKVKLQLREGEHETDWIRIATLMTGADYGTMFVPEVEDEVLVAFHLGDINLPIVIGSLWNRQKKIPAVHEKNDIRKIKTRSGHEIIFDDAEEGSIQIKTKKGIKVHLDDKEEKISIADHSNSNSIEITAKSSNQIILKSSNTKITINSKGEISLEADNKVSIKSVQVGIEASGQMEIKANGSLKLESSGLVTIKGSMVKIN